MAMDSQVQDLDCAICRSEYGAGTLEFLCCAHKFHEDCLATYMNITNVCKETVRCPVCRSAQQNKCKTKSAQNNIAS
jgi:hypothetical protein